MRARQPAFSRSSVAMAAAALVGTLASTPASAATCTWNPASGNWNVAANWSCGFVPTNLDLAVIAAGQSVTVPTFISVPTTTVNNDGTVTLSNGGGMGLSSTNTNNGAINLNSAGSNTDLTINGVVSLNGTGSITTSNTTANRIYGSGSTLNLGAGQSILGSGQLGIGGTLVLNNDGTVSATQGASLTINTLAGVTNNNLLRANGGTLVIANTNVSQGALGRLDAMNGSSVQLQNGTSITGGSFTTSGGGSIDVAGFNTASLSGVTNAGTFNIHNGGGVDLNGALINNGTVNMASAGSNTDITVTGARTISGSGVINMTNTAANRILGPGTLTLGSGQTIQGSGTIGVTSGFSLFNQGTIVATQSAPILINASGGVANTGTLRADGGTLQLQTTIDSAGGSIEARNGSHVQLLNNTVINNANFSTTGVGSLTTTAGFVNVSLGGGTVNGDLTVANGAALRVAGDLAYNGTLTMNSAGSNTDLAIDGVRSIGGTATINMTNTLANRILAANGPGDQLTLGSNVTLQGGGSLGAGSALVVVNNGTIAATSGSGLRVETSGGVTNNGVMRADGGTLSFRNVAVNSAGGTIEAVNGSQVVLENGTSISNANFSASTGGLITTAGFNTVALGGSTISGPMTMANGSALRLTGDVNYNGVLSMASAGSNTDIAFNGARALNGTATLNLSNTLANRLVADTGAGDSVTVGSNITVQGAGSIGAGTQLAVINNGSLIANSSAGMVLATPAGATNNALIRGDGATFTIGANTVLIQGASGVLNAINGGAVVLGNNSQINGGTFSTASGGVVAVAGFTAARVAGVTNTGTLNINNGAAFVLNGTLTNNGSINLASAGSNTELLADGNRSILGTGTITMTNTAANRIVGTAAGDGLTLGSGQTLQGAGSIGAGTNFNFTNQGTVTANLGAPITMSTNASGSLTNAAGGTMQATTGGTLNVNSALTNNGTLAANGGVVNANAAFNGTGTALISGTGQLNVGAASTVGTLTHNGSAANGIALGTNNITVSGDYTNANSGTGDAFNRRANVTGTGQVLAGGNAAQAITGATVTNGNTANATLTINNVRVGTTSYDYQIANTGTTGPSLRGGIQTSVNGGNVSDARLSGSGVTASNYNTGGPGSNTGNLNVTFTAATAGALAPMAGQAVNLRSNFDNIADQRLNIVLGAGAAAYNAAVGAATSPVTVANQRVGGSNNAAVAVANSAPAGAFSEDLNVAVAGTSGSVSAGGSIAGRLAGTNNTGTGAITVSVNSATAGAKTGTVTLGYQTAGAVAGVSNGLGVAGAGSQGVTVNGNVFQAAQPSFGTTNVVFANRHVGTVASQAVSIGNTLVAAGFQEGLSATSTLSGQATGGGSFSNLAAGGSSNAILVGIDTSSAGAKSGAVNVALTSVGSGTSGLADLSLGTQAVNVSGAVYRLAQANTIGPINFGNVLANSVQTRTLTISNTATADGFSEALNAAFGNISGANAASFTTNGTINGLLAGGNDNTTMVVTLNTSATGTKTANLQILLDSNGTAIGNGLGITALPTQMINLDGVITGVVGNLASAGLSPTTVNFGKFREGAANQTQQLTVSNLTSGPGEGLNASFGTASGGVANNGGSITSLATSNSNSTSMSVTLGGLATAGAKNGTQVLSFVSDGSFNAGVTTTLPSQTVNLSAEVFRLAQGNVSPAVTLAARRVGDAAATGAIAINNTAAADGYSEGLVGTVGAAPAGFTVAGPAVTGLLAAGTGTTRSVSLSTATSGTLAGTVNVALASNGAGTSGFGDLALAGASTAVSGKVYAPAVGQLAATPASIDFGTVRVGTGVAAQAVTIVNAASATALNDTLKGTLVVAGAGFTGNGANVSNLIAGGPGGTMELGLDTSLAGVKAGSAQVTYVSQNPDMSDLGLGSSDSIGLSGTVNALANAMFGKSTGAAAFSCSSGVCTLNLGSLQQSSGMASNTLNLQNLVAGPADDLLGSFDFSGFSGFGRSGFDDVDLEAGETIDGMTLSLDTSTIGAYSSSFRFNGFSHNAFQVDWALGPIRFDVIANVFAQGGNVPEPSTLWLLLAAAAGWQVRRRGVAA